jgi:hypothetical protein
MMSVPDAELMLRSRMQALQHENAELQRLLSEAQEALERAQKMALEARDGVCRCVPKRV